MHQAARKQAGAQGRATIERLGRGASRATIAPLAHAEERTRKREARDIVRFRVGLRGVRRGDTPRYEERCGGEVSRCC